jgi:hypothetical protein
MVDIQIRGGSFPLDVKCVFRDDHFRFNEGIFTAADETIYIGDVVSGHVIEARKETKNGPDGRTVMGGAVAGGAVGAHLALFTLGTSIAVGAVIGAAVAGRLATTTTPGHITFEMHFTDNRWLIGTVDNAGWAEIETARRISAAAARLGPILESSAMRPARALPAPVGGGLDGASDETPNEGFVHWVRGFTLWSDAK